jgi:microcystin degradation protein MlrC
MVRTNTFSRVSADYEQFARGGIAPGDAIVREYRDSNATMAGFLEAADRFGVAVPLLMARTGPIGMISRDAFDRIVGEMLQLLAEQGPWDGVLLAQHGAAVSEAHPDVDGEIAARVRVLVRPDVPISMALDMHANISRRMIEQTTAAVVSRTNLHLDPRERALECAELVRTIEGAIRPTQALETPPLVINKADAPYEPAGED